MIQTIPPSNAEIPALALYASMQKAAKTNVTLICTSQSRTMPRLLSCLFTYSPKFHRANYNATRMNNQCSILFTDCLRIVSKSKFTWLFDSYCTNNDSKRALLCPCSTRFMNVFVLNLIAICF